VERVRQYLAQIGYPLDPGALIEKKEQRLSTLCYLSEDGRLLLLRRKKEPFSTYWTAPGGKIEPGETPEEAIVREMREETGLSVHGLRLRAICSETGEDPNYNWLLFIFQAGGYEGELTPSDEGELCWLPLDCLDDWPLPDVDRKLARFVLEHRGEPQFVRVEYAPDYSVERLSFRPLSELCP